MKVYITKYFLTKGILKFENAELCDEISLNMIKVSYDNYTYYYHKPYWHETFKEALEHANELRLNKIKSLRKQLKKLESLDFNIGEK